MATKAQQSILKVFDTLEDRRQRTGYYDKVAKVVTNIQVGKETQLYQVGSVVKHNKSLKAGCFYIGLVTGYYLENGYFYYEVQRQYFINGMVCTKVGKKEVFTDVVRTNDIVGVN